MDSLPDQTRYPGGNDRRVSEQWPDSQITREFAETANQIGNLTAEIQAARSDIDRLPERLRGTFVSTDVHDLAIANIRQVQRDHGGRIDEHDDEIKHIRGQMVSKKTLLTAGTLLLTAAAAVSGWMPHH